MNRLTQIIVLAALAAGVFPLLALVITQGQGFRWDSSIIAVLRFTLMQAAVSTLLSVFPGMAVARALLHTHFAGRSLLLTLFALPMAVPAIVAVLGATALVGNSGLLPGLFALYGLPGILFVHVFFNLPMATRLFYQALLDAPPEGYKLATQLGLSPLQTFAHVEWPVIKAAVPQVAALIFLLCQLRRCAHFGWSFVHHAGGGHLPIAAHGF
jgi:thiamine transport system permease protein